MSANDVKVSRKLKRRKQQLSAQQKDLKLAIAEANYRTREYVNTVIETGDPEKARKAMLKLAGLTLVFIFFHLISGGVCAADPNNKIPQVQIVNKIETFCMWKSDIDFAKNPKVNVTSGLSIGEYFSDISQNALTLQNRSNHVLSCKPITSENQKEYTSALYELRAELEIWRKRYVELINCRSYLTHLQNFLSYFEDIKVDAEKLKLSSCQTRVQMLKGRWDSIIANSHDSKSNAKTTHCDDDPAWKAYGWVRGPGELSCTMGLITNYSYSNPTCRQNDFGGPFSVGGSCVLSNNKFHATSNSLSVHNQDSTPCSLGCFSESDVFLSFTNQPYCTSCFKIFLHYFWSNCFDEISSKHQDIISFVIYNTEAVLKVKDSTKTCSNRNSFRECCGRTGPVGKDYQYVDKFCACGKRQKRVYEKLSHWIAPIKSGVFDFVADFKIYFFFLIVFLLNWKMGIISVVLWINRNVIFVAGDCNVNSIRGQNSIDNSFGLSHNEVRFLELSVGDCFTIGSHMAEVVSIKQTYLYSPEKVIPYHIKPSCSATDWHCPGGVEKISEKLHCAENCGMGILDIYTAHMSDFSGSRCWISSSVEFKQESCFSMGTYHTFARIYQRISLDLKTHFELKLRQLGEDIVRTIKTSDKEIETFLNVISAKSVAKIIPEQISERKSQYQCSYVHHELALFCGWTEFTSVTPLSPACLQLAYTWLPDKMSYEVVMNTPQASVFLADKFHKCDPHYNITNTLAGMELTYDGGFGSIDFVPMKQQYTDWCQQTSIKSTVHPGRIGYRLSTVLLLENLAPTSCRVHVAFHGCTAIQSNIALLRPTIATQFDFLCNVNASVHITINAGPNKWTIEANSTLSSWMPLGGDMRAAVVSYFEKVFPGYDHSDLFSFFHKFDLHSLLNVFQLHWQKYALCLVFLILGTVSFTSGRVLPALIFMIIAFLIVSGYAVGYETHVVCKQI